MLNYCVMMEIIVYLFSFVKFNYGDCSDGGVVVVFVEVVYFSVFDKMSYDEYIIGVCVFYLLVLFNYIFEVGLVMVLVVYCEWVGWFGMDGIGNCVIVFNDVGVWYVEVMVDVEFSSSVVLELIMGVNLLSLYLLSCDGVKELFFV